MKDRMALGTKSKEQTSLKHRVKVNKMDFNARVQEINKGFNKCFLKKIPSGKLNSFSGKLRCLLEMGLEKGCNISLEFLYEKIFKTKSANESNLKAHITLRMHFAWLNYCYFDSISFTSAFRKDI